MARTTGVLPITANWCWSGPCGAGRRERWLLHLALFGATLICSLGAGAALQGRFDPPTGYGPLACLKAGLQFFSRFRIGINRTDPERMDLRGPAAGYSADPRAGALRGRPTLRRRCVSPVLSPASADPVADRKPGCVPETALRGGGPASAAGHRSGRARWLDSWSPWECWSGDMRPPSRFLRAKDHRA